MRASAKIDWQHKRDDWLAKLKVLMESIKG